MNPTPGEWGMCGYKNYLISALTRARKNVILLTIGYHQIVDSISQLITKTGGGNELDNPLQIQTIKQLQGLLINLNIHRDMPSREDIIDTMNLNGVKVSDYSEEQAMTF